MTDNKETLMTLSELADYLGVNYNTILRLKKDTDMPRVQLVFNRNNTNNYLQIQ